MKQPAKSPDHNPIDNFWGLLKQRLRKFLKQPISDDQLFDFLSSELDSSSDDYLYTLSCSMTSGVCKLIYVGGLSTKY